MSTEQTAHVTEVILDAETEGLVKAAAKAEIEGDTKGALNLAADVEGRLFDALMSPADVARWRALKRRATMTTTAAIKAAVQTERRERAKADAEFADALTAAHDEALVALNPDNRTAVWDFERGCVVLVADEPGTEPDQGDQ